MQVVPSGSQLLVPHYTQNSSSQFLPYHGQLQDSVLEPNTSNGTKVLEQPNPVLPNSADLEKAFEASSDNSSWIDITDGASSSLMDVGDTETIGNLGSEMVHQGCRAKMAELVKVIRDLQNKNSVLVEHVKDLENDLPLRK